MSRSAYPTTKEIIHIFGMGALLTSTIFLPGLGHIAKFVNDSKFNAEKKQRKKNWERFNEYLLKRNLKRLLDEKIVEIIGYENEELIKLTKKGSTKFLKI